MGVKILLNKSMNSNRVNHLNLMHGTSCIICPSAWVMFSIWGSVKMGRLVPCHSKVSMWKGTIPWGQRAVIFEMNASSESSAPGSAPDTTMSPSTRLSEEFPWGNAKPSRKGAPCTYPARMPTKRSWKDILASSMFNRSVNDSLAVLCLLRF